jgi:hypothetical protein
MFRREKAYTYGWHIHREFYGLAELIGLCVKQWPQVDQETVHRTQIRVTDAMPFF